MKRLLMQEINITEKCGANRNLSHTNSVILKLAEKLTHMYSSGKDVNCDFSSCKLRINVTFKEISNSLRLYMVDCREYTVKLRV